MTTTFQQRTEASTDLSRWVWRGLQEDHALRLRLFCFPFAGGGAATFRRWFGRLPDGVEICSVQLPGQHARSLERPFDDVDRLAAVFTDVAGDLLSGQYAFFGHSLGALISYSVASLLRDLGMPGPLHLFVSGWRAPSVANPHPNIHHLPDALFLEELGRRYNGLPKTLLNETELLDLTLPGLKASIRMTESYTYLKRSPLDCPITAFGGWQDEMVRTEEIREWRDHTTSAFKMHMLQGDHFFLEGAREQLLAMIAGDLQPHLQSSQGITSDLNSR